MKYFSIDGGNPLDPNDNGGTGHGEPPPNSPVKP